MESLGIVQKLAVDKTGTLTRGFFSVTARCVCLRVLCGKSCNGVVCVGVVRQDVSRVDDQDDVDDYDAMQFAAALESKSAHPLANAVVAGT